MLNDPEKDTALFEPSVPATICHLLGADAVAGKTT